MILGILSILGACLCWGFIFVIPQFLPDHSAVSIAMGRFFFFGLSSAAFLIIKKRSLLNKKFFSFWRQASIFSFVATIVQYVGLVLCLRYANPSITALIYGLAPITISLGGTWKKQGFSLKKFFLPGILTFFGLILINLDAFQLTSSSPLEYVFGLFCGFVGLSSWTWYAVANSEFMEKNQGISSLDWVTMFGTATFCVVSTILLCCLPFSPSNSLQFLSFEFVIGCAILGIVSTYVAFLFWNHGTKKLPIHLVGQLAVFEMLFALLFIFLIEKRFPLISETGGILSILAAVLIVLNREKQILQQQ